MLLTIGWISLGLGILSFGIFGIILFGRSKVTIF